jgi:hypothetical protein
MSPVYEITQSPQEIEHNLGTEHVLVQVWVNGYAVQPDARVEDENTVVVGLPQPFGEAHAVIEPATAAPTGSVAPKESHGNKAAGEGDSSSDKGGDGKSGKGRGSRSG